MSPFRHHPRSALATGNSAAAVAFALAAACGGGDSGTTAPPTPGTVSVSVTQHGNGQDADGFTVIIGSIGHPVEPGAPVTFTPLPPGSYPAVISGMGTGCSADADTVTVTVTSGQTTAAQFSVGCFGAIAFGLAGAIDDLQVYYLGEDGSMLPITSGSYRNIPEDFAPDGSRVLFTSDRSGNKELYTVKIDGTGIVRLTNDSRDVITARWSPDGSKIAFWRQELGGTEPYSLYVVNANGTGEHLVLDMLYDDFDPTWTADGLAIVFSCNRYGHFWDLCSVAPDGSGLHRIFYSNGGQNARTSPAGTYVGFQSFEPIQSIWVASLADTSRVDLTPGLVSFDFAWSPDGTKLSVNTYDGTDYRLQLVNRDGTGLTPITPVTDEAGDAKWSPDGAYLAFYSERGGTQEIWVVRPDGSDMHRLTPLGGTKYRPIWNPMAHATADVVRSRRLP